MLLILTRQRVYLKSSLGMPPRLSLLQCKSLVALIAFDRLLLASLHMVAHSFASWRLLASARLNFVSFKSLHLCL